MRQQAIKYVGNFKAALGVLYVEIGRCVTRVYSSRPVDLEAGFKSFEKVGCSGNLIDHLLETTSAAEKELERVREREDLLTGTGKNIAPQLYTADK